MQISKVFSRKYNILFIFSILLFLSCRQKAEINPIYNITKSAEGDSAMVVTAHPLATAAGLEILRQGGNAIDAAITIQFVLAVCYPGAGNIGGGGFMVYRQADGETAALDYREKAPVSATVDMYLDSIGNAINEKSKMGHLAAGVPGTVDGMVQAFKRYSKLKDWQKLIEPAILVARNGFQITESEATNLNKEQANFSKYNRNKNVFIKENWKEGDLLKQPELATTLELIRDHGRDGFYSGTVADLIVAEMQAGSGIMTKNDLEAYRSVWRTPITFSYRGYQIVSMPPPSSGGIALQQLLKMIEPYNVGALSFQSAAAVHLMVEAERRVYADRAHYLGDPDFIHIPISAITDSIYIQNRMRDFNPRLASLSQEVTHGVIESEETTHYSIIDGMGNAVSMTTTLNSGYGSFVVVSGAGFILNNEMDDFSVKKGVANMFGLLGAEANKIEPSKRMLSSMTPTIVLKDDKLKMVLGSPGGSTIITSVFQTIVNVIDFGMNIDDAIQSPRFHHQWIPDEISVEENAIDIKERKIIEIIGHKFKTRGPIGRVDAIMVDSNNIFKGAADKRGDDDAKGY